MADLSKRDGVLDDLCTTLRAMRKANGYTWDVQTESVTRDPVNILAVPEASLPFFMVEPTPQGSFRFMPAMQVQHDFNVLITARVDANGNEADRKSKAWEALIADLEKALVADITRGGRASDTRLGEPSPLVGLGTDGIVIVTLPLTIKLWRTYGQP